MTVVEQNSTDPTSTGHLHAGERITLDELATHLSAARVWLRQLAVAAERPAVPVELGKLCDELDRMAKDLGDRAAELAKTDAVIRDERPLPRTLFGSATCGAEPGRECRTRTGRLAELDHQPRRQKAVATIDAGDAAA